MKILKDKITIIVEKTDTGFSAYAENYPIYTTAANASQLFDNALEATNLFFENEDIIITHDHIKFEIDFSQFFQYYKLLNARHLATKIGMNPTLLSQYIQGHKKPSRKQTEKILDGIHRIGRELSEINLIVNS